MSTGRRRPGGQPGNTNGLKHGFYADRFSRAELRRLDQESTLMSEINHLRIMVDRMAAQLFAAEVYGESEQRLAGLIIQACTAIGNLTTRHAFLHSTARGVEEAMESALQRTMPSWGSA